MSVKMSNKSKPNKGVNEAEASSEGLLPGKCPIGEQDGPSHHRTTADRRTTRRKWSQEENRVVMQCYCRSQYGRVSMGEMDTGKECMSYGMKWECLM